MKWLNKEGRLKSKRYSQDIEWLKGCVLREYGSSGLQKFLRKIDYTKNPFSTISRIFKNLEN